MALLAPAHSVDNLSLAMARCDKLPQHHTKKNSNTVRFYDEVELNDARRNSQTPHRFHTIMSHFALVAALFCFVGIVAAIMKCVEEQPELEERTRFASRVVELRVKLETLVRAGHSLSDEEMDSQSRVLVNELLQLGWAKGRQGVPISGHKNDTVPPVWSMSNALLFAASLVAQIGYGHLVPLTALGKVLSQLFALLGIPLFIVTISDVGRSLHHLSRKMNTDDGEDDESRFTVSERCAIAVFLFAMFCALMAMVYRAVEGWQWLDCAYFAFVSFQGIGFGDIGPSSALSSTVTIFAIFFGLMFFVMACDMLGTVYVMKIHQMLRFVEKLWKKALRCRTPRLKLKKPAADGKEANQMMAY